MSASYRRQTSEENSALELSVCLKTGAELFSFRFEEIYIARKEGKR